MKILKWSTPLMIVVFILCSCMDGDKTYTESYTENTPEEEDINAVIYGVTVGTNALGSSILVSLDKDGDLVEEIGPVGYYVNGLEYDKENDTLYGTTGNTDPSFKNGLIEINTNTGEGTPIGTGAGRLVNNPTVNSEGEMFAWTENGDDLVRVNAAAGTVTVVGNSGLGTAEHGLDFDNDDNLIFVNYNGNIYRMNTATGAPTYLTSIGVMAHHGDFDPETGLYYGIDETWSTMGYTSGPRNLLVVDVENGTIVDTLETIDDLHAVTFTD